MSIDRMSKYLELMWKKAGKNWNDQCLSSKFRLVYLETNRAFLSTCGY